MAEATNLKIETVGPPLSIEEERKVERAIKNEIAKNYTDPKIHEHFKVPAGQLTKKELGDVRKYARYALTEILKAAVTSPIAADQCGNTRDRIACASELVLKVSFHELCHSFGSYESDGRVVPDFLLLKNQSYDEKLLRDEVHTFTYWPEYEQVPLYLTLTDASLTEQWIKRYEARYGGEPVKSRRDRVFQLSQEMRSVDRTSFEAVFDLSQKVVLLMFEIVTAELLRSSNRQPQGGPVGPIISHIDDFKEEIKHSNAQPNLAKKILNNPDPTNKAHAKRIFTAYTSGDKKAVFNEAIVIMRRVIKDKKL
jgi:hypothetical protein